MSQKIEKINISKLQGNQPATDEERDIPYEDVEKIALKINEIIDFLERLK